MTTKQRLVYGTKNHWSDDGGLTSDPIPEVEGLAVPVVDQEFVEVTNNDSPGGYREYIAGLKDPGELTVTCGYTSQLYDKALGYQASNTLLQFETELTKEVGQETVGDTFVYNAFVRPRIVAGATPEAMKLELVLRITGEPVYTRGA